MANALKRAASAVGRAVQWLRERPRCPSCGAEVTPAGSTTCPCCNAPLHPDPLVREAHEEMAAVATAAVQQPRRPGTVMRAAESALVPFVELAIETNLDTALAAARNLLIGAAAPGGVVVAGALVVLLVRRRHALTAAQLAAVRDALAPHRGEPGYRALRRDAARALLDRPVEPAPPPAAAMQ